MSLELNTLEIPGLSESIRNSPQYIESLKPPNTYTGTSSLTPFVSANKPLSATPPSGPITTSRSKDIEDMIQVIKKHMENFDIVSNIKPIINSKTLTIPTRDGVNEITTRCLLSFMSGNPDFLKRDRDDCAPVFSSYLTDGMVDLTKLIDLSRDGSAITDINFYNNLYGFNMELIKFITTKEFEQVDPVTRHNIVEGVYGFVDQTIKYLTRATNTHGVIDGKIIVSAIDLLYLQNLLNLERVSISSSPQDLFRTYEVFVEAVRANIDALNDIMRTGQPTDLTPMVDPEVAELQNDLEVRIEKLKDNLVNLREILSNVETNKTSIAARASKHAQELASEIQNKIKSRV